MSTERDKLFETYAEHTRILRTWLVAYGVGGPVLILTNDTVFAEISKSVNAPCVAILFGIGVAAQVAIALINKVSIWVVYYGEEHESFRATRCYKIADGVSRQFWIDAGADVISIGTFAWATGNVFAILFGTI